MVSYGLVHLLVAWLALMVAFGVDDVAASPRGAVATIAHTGFGSVVLVLVTAGLTAFALWQITAAVLGLTGATGGDRFRKRIGAAAKAGACTTLAVLTAGFVDGRGKPSGGPVVRTLTADVLALPGGPLLVGLAATVVLGVAVGMVYTGVRRTFLQSFSIAVSRDRARYANTGRCKPRAHNPYHSMIIGGGAKAAPARFLHRLRRSCCSGGGASVFASLRLSAGL